MPKTRGMQIYENTLCERKESDLRPLSYQDSVLPLNYARVRKNYSKNYTVKQKLHYYFRHKVHFPWLVLTIPPLWYMARSANF